MVMKINEANTSKLCSRCGSQGLRHNGKFVCPKCKVELNADCNGALNILKRALGYISRAGAALTQPGTRYDEAMRLKNQESHGFSRGVCQMLLNSLPNVWRILIQFFHLIFSLIVVFCNLIVKGDIFGVNLLEHAVASLIRVGVGFAVAIITAVPLGLLIGWNKKISAATHPLIEILRHIPPIAWIPFSIVFFGLGLFSSAFIVWLGAFFPILLNTASGVKNIGRAQIDVAITLGAKEKNLISKVVFPAILPEVITGMRVGLGVGWMCVIASEMIGLRKPVGLGFFVLEMQYLGRYSDMVAGMIMIGLVGLLLDYGLRFLEYRFLRWREEIGG